MKLDSRSGKRGRHLFVMIGTVTSSNAASVKLDCGPRIAKRTEVARLQRLTACFAPCRDVSRVHPCRERLDGTTTPFQGRFDPLYQVRRCKPAMAINCHRNKPIGPGGGTRRLHPSPSQQDGFRRGRNRIDEGVKGVLSLGMVPPLSDQICSCKRQLC